MGSHDVVVYGSSPAGIAAAVAASTLGLSVALYEPLPMIGGMGAAGNLALNDGGLAAERTGLALNFSLLNGAHYGLATEVPHPESFVAEASFRTMLAAAGVSVVKTDCRLLSATSVGSAPSRVGTLSLHCEPEPVGATVFVDASYDGEVMVAAGDIAYTAGREAIATYNESLAGARAPGFAGVSGPQHVDALRDDGTLLKFVANVFEARGAGRGRRRADGLSIASASRASGPRAVAEARRLRRRRLLAAAAALDASGGTADAFTRLPPPTLPGLPSHIKKYCVCCGISVAATDQPMLNKGWASASWEKKQEIVAAHTYFDLGSFYYLAHDAKVPAATRAKVREYGLCRDEFAAFGHVPPQLYVRISNRLSGDFVLTQNNLANPRTGGPSRSATGRLTST